MRKIPCYIFPSSPEARSMTLTDCWQIFVGRTAIVGNCQQVHFYSLSIKNNDNLVISLSVMRLWTSSGENCYEETITFHLPWIYSHTIFELLSKTSSKTIVAHFELFEMVFRMFFQEILNYVLVLSPVNWASGIGKSQWFENFSCMKQELDLKVM